MRIVLITGISGSGKSVALNVLEDAGYYCVDNLAPPLLPALVRTIDGDQDKKVAVAVDARSAESLAELPAIVSHMRDEGHHVKIIFLTSSTHSLVARFSETRRSHPLSHELRPRRESGLAPHAHRMHPRRTRPPAADRKAGPRDRHVGTVGQ